MLSEIEHKEIQEGDVVKVNAIEDEIEEPAWGVVAMNTGTVLGVRYLSMSTQVYKNATVYRLDEETQPVRYETLLEHWPSGATLEDAGFRGLGDDRWASLDEIDEGEDSDIWSEEEDDDDDSLDGFIVRDEDVPEGERFERPPDAGELDAEWSAWEPRSPGARSFKETVDMIEMRAKHGIF